MPLNQKFSYVVQNYVTNLNTGDSQDGREREGTIFYSTLSLPPAHEHSEIYLQLRMWDDYRMFLIASLVFTRQLLDGIYHVIQLPFEWLMKNCYFFTCLLNGLILGFCCSNLTQKSRESELTSNGTLVLLENWLTKSSSHPKKISRRSNVNK